MSQPPGHPFSTLAAGSEQPDELALVEGERSWTWSRLAREVGVAVVWLESQGVRGGGSAGDLEDPRVVFTGDTSADAVIFTLACLELGVTAVPLHPRWPAAVRREILEQIEPAAELCAGWRAPGALPKPLTFEQARPRPEPDPEMAAAIVYTSGSSGARKGVVLSRRAFLASAAASASNLGWQRGDRWLLNLPTAHVGGLSVVTRCLAARRTIVVQPPGSFTAEAFAETVRSGGVTLASLVPTMLHRLLDAEPPWTPPAHLRAILLGGAPASPALLEAAAERGIPVLPTYGLSEACSQVATRRPAVPTLSDRGEGSDPGQNSPGDCIGPPLPTVEVSIAGGEILVRGATLFSSYVPPDAVPSPVDDDGWLHTGDLGFLDQAGNLHVLGRRSDLIITGGENVSPTAVEHVLERHPAVRTACVLGIDDPHWGQLVAAALVPGPGGPVTDTDLEPFLAKNLAPHEKPRRVLWLDELPLGPTGKVDREAVRRRLGGLEPKDGAG